MAYEMVMPYHLHMPSYFLETFTEYPYTVCCNGLYGPLRESVVGNRKKGLNCRQEKP